MALLISLASRWAGPFLVLAAGLVAGVTAVRAQVAGAGVEASRIKAVFVLNFVHFVEWPPGTLPPGDAPLVIGVLGSDPLAGYLEDAVRGEKRGDHPLVVRPLRTDRGRGGCAILFIGQSSAGDLGGILARLGTRSILTVGDAEGFSERGGMISLVTANNKIRLKINIGAARAADLRIDARLLRPAQIVTTAKG